MHLHELQIRALEIAGKYNTVNSAQGNAAWDASAYMAGFVGDVGDLSKLVMAKANLRKLDKVDDKIAHELSDCLWSVLVLAKKLDVNLETEFEKTMQLIEKRIDNG